MYNHKNNQIKIMLAIVVSLIFILSSSMFLIGQSQNGGSSPISSVSDFATINHVSTFSKAGSTSVSIAPVNLGTAGNFTILSKSGISTTGTTSITGNIGVSPASAKYITGFGLAMSSTGQYATSSYVTGKVYAADYSSPTPTYLTTAIGDMQTAYTNAAGRTNPNYVNLGAGNINGMTLSPGLYKWGTDLGISTSVTISGSASSVWIFQISGKLTFGNSAKIILSGGALPQNIFWQVAGGATLGTNASFSGIILSQTAITMATGATMNGRAFAQTAVTLEANTITEPTSTYTPVGTYTITFSESGLTSGTSWSVSINGVAATPYTTSTISFVEINGTYTYTVNNVTGYSVSPASGTITVNGNSVTKNIVFTSSNTTSSSSADTYIIVGAVIAAAAVGAAALLIMKRKK
ncbi:MAG: ice-binding family protein [Thermoplasmataceae archaeon]